MGKATRDLLLADRVVAGHTPASDGRSVTRVCERVALLGKETWKLDVAVVPAFSRARESTLHATWTHSPCCKGNLPPPVIASCHFITPSGPATLCLKDLPLMGLPRIALFS